MPSTPPRATSWSTSRLSVGPEGHDRLVIWISGNQAPDLANVSAGWMVEFNAIDALEPLDDKFSPGFLDAFEPAGLDAMRIDGKLMGLPYFLDPRALYYRTDLFEAAGLEPPATWDEVRAAAKALHNPPDVYGIGIDNDPAAATVSNTPSSVRAGPAVTARTANPSSTARSGSGPRSSWSTSR